MINTKTTECLLALNHAAKELFTLPWVNRSEVVQHVNGILRGLAKQSNKVSPSDFWNVRMVYQAEKMGPHEKLAGAREAFEKAIDQFNKNRQAIAQVHFLVPYNSTELGVLGEAQKVNDFFQFNPSEKKPGMPLHVFISESACAEFAEFLNTGKANFSPQNVLQIRDFAKALNNGHGLVLICEHLIQDLVILKSNDGVKHYIYQRMLEKRCPDLATISREKKKLTFSDVDQHLLSKIVKFFNSEEANFSHEELASAASFSLRWDCASLMQHALERRKNPEEMQLYLYRACLLNSPKVLQLLLNQGAKVDEVHSFYAPFTPIDWALAHGKFETTQNMIKHFGRSYEEFLEDKYLAHVYGVGGFSEPRPIRTNYQGFNRLLASQKLSSLACAFLDEVHTLLKPEEKELIKKALQDAPANITKNPALLLGEIKAGNPVVLFTGWNTHINVVIFLDNLVIKCDRGAGANYDEWGIEILTMTKDDELLSVIRDLQEMANKSQGQELYKQEINVRLGLKRVELILQKRQPTGNCGETSSKSAFFGLVYAVLQKRRAQDHRTTLINSASVYKTWSPDLRERVLKEYKAKVKNPDTKLLEIVHMKAEERRQKRAQ